MSNKRIGVVITLTAVLVASGCSTKRYVSKEVGAVNQKVENLSESVERNQERIGRNADEISRLAVRVHARCMSSCANQAFAGIYAPWPSCQNPKHSMQATK